MAVNKIVDRNNNTLLDLTFDTVTPEKVLLGETFHDKYGNKKIGTLTGAPSGGLDTSKYNFIDYDGTLLYSYTDEELDALTTLPNGANHTGDNLTFQSWNWSLENLKTWNRERADRPIVGANYITTDGKSYLYFDTPLTGASLKFSVSNSSYLTSVDWGDGTVDTSFSSTTIEHRYANPGEYIVVIDISDGYWYFGGYSVSASTNKQYIKRIKLGTMTDLGGGNHFNNLHSLTSITIPDGVKSIPYESFYNCYSLTSIVIPEGVTSISDEAFYACYSLTSVVIPNSVTSIGGSAFYDCSSLTSVVIPDSFTSIAYRMFYSCSSLTSIVIPGGVTKVSSYAFNGCTSLTSIEIPAGVTTIEDGAFYNCRSLTSIVIPEGVTQIGYNSFSGCRGLISVVIPDRVTTIGQTAFENCTSLTSIVIGSGVTSIGSNAFRYGRILTLDISRQTKVISLTTSIGLNTSAPQRILVPASLLANYKSASYWSSYADIMVGV